VLSFSSGRLASLSEADLLAALRADEEGSFAEIYQRYCYRLFTVAYQKLKNREAAEELVQDLFENLWNRRASHDIQQLEQYLFSALRYRIINHIKAQQVRTGYELYCRLAASRDIPAKPPGAIFGGRNLGPRKLVGKDSRVPPHQVAEAAT
jgi:DNA-directed RNA polymerase specialized sigma24 family protein